MRAWRKHRHAACFRRHQHHLRKHGMAASAYQRDSGVAARRNIRHRKHIAAAWRNRGMSAAASTSGIAAYQRSIGNSGMASAAAAASAGDISEHQASCALGGSNSSSGVATRWRVAANSGIMVVKQWYQRQASSVKIVTWAWRMRSKRVSMARDSCM